MFVGFYEQTNIGIIIPDMVTLFPFSQLFYEFIFANTVCPFESTSTLITSKSLRRTSRNGDVWTYSSISSKAGNSFLRRSSIKIVLHFFERWKNEESLLHTPKSQLVCIARPFQFRLLCYEWCHFYWQNQILGMFSLFTLAIFS